MPTLHQPDSTCEAIRLYVGGSARTVNSRPMLLTGARMFNAALPSKQKSTPRNPLCYRPPQEAFTAHHLAELDGWIDSGAFQDLTDGRRLNPAAALARQMRFEDDARERWGSSFTLGRLVSYDLLIDEKWIPGVGKRKVRWSVEEAERAVRVTVDAAKYLTSQRANLSPRGLVLACQGVDDAQYAECVSGVLAHARSEDVIGLGGWCILGRNKTMLPTFFRTIQRVLPAIAASGVKQVHVFGVLWRPALGGLLWLADRHGLKVSTDSGSPVLAACWKTATPSNKKCDRWEDNCEWWRRELAGLRTSEWYREPAQRTAVGQLLMF